MITNYFKIARRVIMRNKIFSFINIAGLAASMSVGLLFITIMSDVMQFDAFHEKKERIIRVTTDYVDSNGNTVPLASSSMAVGKAISEQISEVQTVTTVSYGFGGDFQNGQAILPIHGFWAEPSFFEVFTFPLQKGNPETALSKPNSIVLTQASAIRIFGNTDVLGKVLVMKKAATQADSAYIITGVLKDLPKFSHIQFEALGSSTTLPDQSDWYNVWSNYTYALLQPTATREQLQLSLDRLAKSKNDMAGDIKDQVSLGTQRITDIVFFGRRLDNQIGPTMPPRFLWLMSGLSIIVLTTACFNYTNLSVARASRRLREVGIRKVIGAKRRQLLFQFIAESVVISMVALLFAFIIFTLIRSQFMSLTPNLTQLFDMKLSPLHVALFVVFAMVTGLVSGVLPGIFFSKVKIASAMRGSSVFGVSGRTSGRKVLIVFQYVFALTFITSTVILYKQYRDFVTFDLGFSTRNIINVDLQGNSPDVLQSQLSQLSEVTDISRSHLVTSIGQNYYTHVKHGSSKDSIRAWYNKIDERYLTVLDFKIIAGRNFVSRTATDREREVIVNRKLLEQLHVGENDPGKAIGETVRIEGKSLQIVGVVDNFHHNTIENQIGPFLFRQSSEPHYLNLKISSKNIPITIEKITTLWKQIDLIHPVRAELYDHQLEFTYREYLSIGKVVGFLAFLTIVISSLGLLGMVVFAAETRMKEMGIRRVMGARTIDVTYLLGRNFIVLLLLSGFFAIPLTWFFFTNIVLSNVVYHKPIGFIELFAGAFIVGLVALVVVTSQGVKVAQKNPSEVLKNE